jgi:predicted transcriptional regulator
MVAELLKMKRVENKLTQKQLATKAGVSFVCINRIEKGQLPRLAIIQKLFDAMGYEVSINVVNKIGQSEIAFS